VPVEGVAEFGEFVVGAGEDEALVQVRLGDPAYRCGDGA